ncbi:hypothetical protein CC99x_003110 [Candidatus Berkiella cookevillensis]|uniref:Uncharacterized protein n=1 Tax=Candidatus Berkiella cookevillensis TaxID=437022 RepID=A0A0Q9YDC5_9GAMM|nr:hypothetical protein [Candidatus Berkiella cookevillensis]MCS5707887.1 hypothetical protein [Candidatus Berkiella cookevillensis]
MSADTSKFLDNVNLQDLSRSYLLAYLKSKGIEHQGVEPVQDNQWNFGAFEEGHLIRTDNNALFMAFTCPEITDDQAAVSQQSIGSNLQERMLDVVAYLIANKIKKLPEKNIELGFYINHNNGHWTSMLAKFSSLNEQQYQALYEAYQQHSESTGENKTDSGEEKELRVRVNNVRNFILEQKQILLNHRDKDTNDAILSNWALPLDAKSIQLQHFDSLGTKTGYHDTVEAACGDFILNHTSEKATFVRAESKIQKGMTCGDWSVYNIFRHGVLKKKAELPSSQQLRMLAENTSVANAHEILFKNEPNVTEVPEDEQIRIPHFALQYEEDIEPSEPEDQPGSQAGDDEPTSTPDSSISSKPVINNARLNHRFPWTYALSKTAFMAFMMYATHVVFPLVVVGFAVSVFAFAAIALTSYFLFDVMLQGFFGQMKLNFQLNKEGVPVKEKASLAGGWGKLLGINAPYHQTLPELEQHLSELLASKADKPMDAKELEQHLKLTHTYARKMMNQNPEFFYPEDVKTVNEASYKLRP